MTKKKDNDVVALPVKEVQQSGCVVCGQYTGTLDQLTPAARVHAECAAARPDVVAKVKARQ